MRFYTASKLGSKRTITPEGFLVCLDVPIARTGEMIYAPQELPGLKPGKDGLIRVRRDPDEVFKPEALASFVGKPTTNDHPPEMVRPSNFRRFTTGCGQNLRQGDGDQSDLVLADLMWWDPQAIKDINDGKDEISNGYDAEYEEIEPGIYRQLNITGNHIALVSEARCGPRCSIGDSAAALQSTKAADAVLNPAPACGCGGHENRDSKPARAPKRKTRDMSTKKTLLNSTVLGRIRRSFAAKDEAGFEEAMTAVEEVAAQSEEEQSQAQFAQMVGEAVSNAIAPIVERLAVVEQDVTDRKTRDAEAEEAKKKEEQAANDRRARDEKTDEEKAAEEKAAREAEERGTKDSPDLAAFLKSKGLSDGDVAAAVAIIKKDGAPSTEAGTGDEGLTEEEKAEAAKKNGATDSISLLAQFRDTVAKAEILSPGIKLPVFDAKATATLTSDAMCALRRLALKSAYDSAERKAHVEPFLDSATPDFSKMTCDAIKIVFGGASELAKRSNAPVLQVNDSAHVARDASARGTIVGMNAAAKELWKTAR
ncbi:MAG: DUF2213 domain-containing protein [Bradyrhizobium sp.]|nr:DUF2213 domain-containing protein [Bradyrhizobium sp.]